MTITPTWVPSPVRLYLDHTASGITLHELARRSGKHPSTILRTVRKCEQRRDDPLFDQALTHLCAPLDGCDRKDAAGMTAHSLRLTPVDEATLDREARRVLRRLAEPCAVMAIAPDMEKAVVMREFPDGKQARTAVVEQSIAQAFVLQDWIALRKKGRVSTYEITAVGRATLKRLIDAEDRARQAENMGLAEAAMPFANQHRTWAQRTIEEDGSPRKIRVNLAESPIQLLGRRRDKDGNVFLNAQLVEVAERLREDFELAQMGPRITQNWEKFLTGGDRGGFRSDNGIPEGPRHARDRVAAALRDLGPGLGDIALRVCCHLEGVEAAEKRMGWAARSGKVVLRIALERLRRHYLETYSERSRMIG